MRKYIFDTDLGADCDDCGAMAVLCDGVKQGIAEVVAVTHCTSEIFGAYGARRFWTGSAWIVPWVRPPGRDSRIRMPKSATATP